MEEDEERRGEVFLKDLGKRSTVCQQLRGTRGMTDTATAS
jgi:hypothetical protein